LPGAFWGTTIPGPFTSTSADGCLTFRFRSDNVVNKLGWIAEVSCEAATSCPKPTGVVALNLTEISAVIGWNASSSATSWEILALPCGTTPTASSTGIVSTINPGVISGLTPGTCYSVYVRAICSETDQSNWSNAGTFTTLVSCPNPVQLNTTDITETSATLNWFASFGVTSWEVLALPCVSPNPLPTDSGTISTTSSYTINNLNPFTCYSLYVRAVCSPTDSSIWSGPFTITTLALPPTCGDQFFDNGGPTGNYANNANSIVTICPENPGELVTVTFTTFDTEANWDGLLVYDGNSTNAPQLASTNGPGIAGLANLPGAFWGTTIPGPFTSSSPDGCLTFRFISDSSVVSSGWSANVTCSPDNDKLILIAFVDTNNNGIKDNSETNFANGSFVYDMNDSGSPMTGFSPTGQYVLYDTNPANSYDISYQVQSNYTTYYNAGTTNYSNVTIPVGSNYQIFYFPITIVQGYNDVTVSIVSNNPPRPGFTYTNKIVYKNLGLTPTSGSLTFTKDPLVTITNITQAGTVANTTGFTYSFTNLAPNETRYFYVGMSVPTIPTVALGNTLTNVASISAPSGDIDLTNNTFSNSQIIVASWDPNDKAESHGGRIVFADYNQNDYLYYTIRFQNEGTANAEFVIIEDDLDSQIDASTIQMINASHNYNMTRHNNELKWEFRNINLVPKTVNEEASMGFVLFKVKLKPGIQVGDIVPNTASIFFDFNPPIITNTFNTEFVTLLSNQTFTDSNFDMYPNPTSTIVTIKIDNNLIIKTINLTDVLGKSISTTNINSNEKTLDISNLAKGIYLVEITTQENLKLVKKLIVK
jgi:hypothetical protein